MHEQATLKASNQSRQPAPAPGTAPEAYRFKCGAPLRAGSLFCAHCGCSIGEEPGGKEDKDVDGTKPRSSNTTTPAGESTRQDARKELAATEPEPGEPSSRTCSVCQEALPLSARYCLACGAAIAPQTPQLVLMRLGDGGPTKVAALDKDDVLIGKSDQCQVSLSNDGYASRRHARLSRTGEQLVVEDLGSSNGTFVRVRRPFALDVGDEILIGSTAFRVEQIS